MEAFNQIDKTLLLILDGTSIEVFKPSLLKVSRAMYVQYKKHHAWHGFIACNPDGTLSYLSSLYVGLQDDAVIYDLSGLKGA